MSEELLEELKSIKEENEKRREIREEEKRIIDENERIKRKEKFIMRGRNKHIQTVFVAKVVFKKQLKWLIPLHNVYYKPP